MAVLQARKAFAQLFDAAFISGPLVVVVGVLGELNRISDPFCVTLDMLSSRSVSRKLRVFGLRRSKVTDNVPSARFRCRGSLGRPLAVRCVEQFRGASGKVGA